jgi:hypothetical protein
VFGNRLRSLNFVRTVRETLQADESNGGPTTVTFTRVIVMPDGHKYIEGVTPKQLPPPASHTLPSDETIALDHK